MQPGQTGYVGNDPVNKAANALADSVTRGQSPAGMSPEEADLIRKILGRYEDKQQAETAEKRRAGRIGRSAGFGQDKAKGQDAFARAQAGKDRAEESRKRGAAKRISEQNEVRGTLKQRIERRRELDVKQREARIKRLLGKDPGSGIGRSKITGFDGKTTYRVAGVDQDLSSEEQADQQVAELTNPQNLPYEVSQEEERLDRIRRLLGKSEKETAFA